MDGYKDSAKKAAGCAYHLGIAAMEQGDYAAAAELLTQAGSYEDAAAQRQRCQYLQAQAAEQAGDIESAIALYESLDRYEDAASRAAALYAAMGEKAEAQGQVLTAAGYYVKAGSHPGAAEKAAALYDSYYGEVSAAATAAMDSGDYALAVTLLANTDLESARGTPYDRLNEMWRRANYSEGTRLLPDDPYGALPYLTAAAGYQDTDSLLNRNCFRLPGTWQTADGRVFEFRTDYTCTIDGVDMAFFVDGGRGLDLLTGPAGTEKADLTKAYTISSLRNNRLTLRDASVNFIRNVDLTLVSAGLTLPEKPAVTPTPTPEPTQTPVPEVTPAPEVTPTPTPDDFRVVDDEN